MKNVMLGNWGLKLLALILALVVYYSLKVDPIRFTSYHDTKQSQSR